MHPPHISRVDLERSGVRIELNEASSLLLGYAFKPPMDDLVLFYPAGHSAHFQPGHPERPERLEALKLALQQAGWWETFPRLEPLRVEPEVLRRVHTPAYLELLQAACQAQESLDEDTYTTRASWQLALNAAGGAAAVAQAVWRREARCGFALTRPPGHHATRSRGMGFCLLNNIGYAAETLLESQGAQRLAIVDLDLHHGNGTQDIFWEREEVFYLSIHQSPLFPGDGMLEETGAGPGIMRTANFPLPPGSGDQAYSAAMGELVLPLLDRFEPEMLLVSVGFDPHWRDPLGDLLLTVDGYGRQVQALRRWAEKRCSGRIALFLEGGYDLEASNACGLATVAALLGQPWQDPLGPAPWKENPAWERILRKAKEIWGFL